MKHMTLRPAPPRIKLTCLDGDQCALYIEPWGTELTLRRGDVFVVESEAFASGDVEVSRVPGGMSLGFTADASVRIFDRSGRDYDI